MKKINNIFNTTNKSLFAIGDTSRRSTPDSSGQRRILLSSCRGPISPLARGVPARAGCRKFGVWFAALVALFIATPSFAEPTELDKKTVASKAYVDTKQDKITTGLAEFDDLGTTATVPALVVTNAAGTALNGNTIGFLDLNTFNHLESAIEDLPDTLVPSIGLIDAQLQNMWNHMPSPWTALTWDSAETTSTNAYDITFVGDTGATANAWPRTDKNELVNTAALAQGLALKQNKLAAKTSSARAQAVTRSTAGNTSSAYITAGGSVGLTTRSGAPAVINYVNGTVATDADMTTFTSGTFGSDGTSYQTNIKNALVSLELLKDVYSELNAKITNNALPTGTTGTVVTYNGTNATTGVQEFGERAVYDPANTYNASTDATKLATMASVKYVCAGYEPAAAGQPAHDGTHPGDEDYCWLWALPN